MSLDKKDITANSPLPPGEAQGESDWRSKRHTLAIKAQGLRRNSTDAENVLWQKIRNRQVCGAKFKKQFPIGPYVADFACIEKMLVIEVDGGQHYESNKDKTRTEYLKKRGYDVLRFWNNEILGNIEGVIDTLALKISRDSFSRSAGEGWDEGVVQHERCSGAADYVGHPHPNPLPQAGEGIKEKINGP
jgi:very-short-patch-repair endonuclease